MVKIKDRQNQGFMRIWSDWKFHILLERVKTDQKKSDMRKLSI